MRSTLALTLSALVASAYAKTDLQGCTSSETVAYGGASMIYWVPGTGEICSFLDCGGGMAPPKTTVPGCPQYSGTASYTPEYLSGFGQAVATSAANTPATTSASGGLAEATSEALSAASSNTSSIESAATITSHASLPLLTGTAAGTGSLSIRVSATGGNNVTGTATLSSRTGSGSVPTGTAAATGAANALGVVGQGIVGLAVGAIGLAML